MTLMDGYTRVRLTPEIAGRPGAGGPDDWESVSAPMAPSFFPRRLCRPTCRAHRARGGWNHSRRCHPAAGTLALSLGHVRCQSQRRLGSASDDEVLVTEDVPIGGDWGVADSALRLNLLAIHLPEIDLDAAVLPPENVAVAIAV